MSFLGTKALSMKLQTPLFLLLALGLAFGTFNEAHAATRNNDPDRMALYALPTPQRGVPSSPLDIHINGLRGENGRFRSQVAISVQAIPGVTKLEMRVDRGSWQQLDSIQLTEDGVHQVDIQGIDAAGKRMTLSQEIKIDQHDPIGQFTEPHGGTAVHGLVAVSGTVHDDRSGMGRVNISLDDGATWQDVPLHADGAWSVPWDTRSVPDGRQALQAKFTDQAGNTSHGKIFYVVLNRPAQIHLTPRWSVEGKGSLAILPGDLMLMDVTIDISDPRGRWPAVHRNYSPHHVPKEIAWDGSFGETQATPGEYPVTVQVTDQMAQKVEAHGVIVIPPAATPTEPPSLAASNPTHLLLVLITGFGGMIALACIAVGGANLRPIRKLKQVLLAVRHQRKK
jgi:hypothetical protein